MKKGLFKKILVAMMCIALTLGMAACGSKKVKVGTGENQSSEDTVKGSKSAYYLRFASPFFGIDKNDKI